MNLWETLWSEMRALGGIVVLVFAVMYIDRKHLKPSAILALLSVLCSFAASGAAWLTGSTSQWLMQWMPRLGWVLLAAAYCRLVWVVRRGG